MNSPFNPGQDSITLTEALFVLMIEHGAFDATNVVECLRRAQGHLKEELEIGDFELHMPLDRDFADDMLITAMRNGRKDIFFS
ncbi:hypothetical protein SEA_CHEETO1_52 [Microbacterium phage Cheeto1]|nr:hypothetical protein SEA_CHEETO1_52 [Microbacterium phage Cheeto1]